MITFKQQLLLIIIFFLTVNPIRGYAEGVPPMVHIVPERLPDMNVPRSGHGVFYLNGELTVFGGHTRGFVPTPTAEYLTEDGWQTMKMVYTHDNATAVKMRSGKVLLAGGHDQPLGIGQTFMVEWYDPKTHSFEGFGCLAQKRVLSAAVELDSGRVVIAGNHYAKDGIELFDGKKLFHWVKSVTQEHASPFLLRQKNEEVLILSGADTRDRLLDSVIVERLKGTSFAPPLLKEWFPVIHDVFIDCSAFFIGNEEKDSFVYLLPVFNHQFEAAVMMVCDTVFSLLPTVPELPCVGIDGDTLLFEAQLLADRERKLAYLMAVDLDERHYIFQVDYTKRPAPLTIYYTDPMPACGRMPIVLSPEGNIVVCGGLNMGHKQGLIHHDNYDPLGTVWMYRMVPEKTDGEGNSQAWWIALVIVLIVAGGCGTWWLLRRRGVEPEDDAAKKDPAISTEEMMVRIRELMTSEQLFLRSDLKVSDLAVRLGTNARYVSNCINQQEGMSFAQFVNGFRIDYAQQLMHNQPETKISSIAYHSGFANETSFFRAFKAVTGKTPKEWQNNKK